MFPKIIKFGDQKYLIRKTSVEDDTPKMEAYFGGEYDTYIPCPPDPTGACPFGGRGYCNGTTNTWWCGGPE